MNTASRRMVNTFLIIGVAFLCSCSKRIIKSGDLPKKQITIGSYGGFSGMNRKNIFLKNGLVFVSETMPGGKETIRFEKKISKKKARQMFKAGNQINFKNLSNGAPCNMTYYIERKRWLRKDHSYSWCGKLDTTQANLYKVQSLLKLNNTN
jgi:hypothetical protein